MRDLVYEDFPDPRTLSGFVLKEQFVRAATKLADRLVVDDDLDRLDSLFAVFTQIDAELQRLDGHKGARS